MAQFTKGPTLRVVLKLLCLALLGVVTQVGFESASMVRAFPLDCCYQPFDEVAYRRYLRSADEYHASNCLSQWLVGAVFNIDFPNAC